MKKVILYPLTLIFYFSFLLALCSIHLIQWIAHKFFGAKILHKAMNYIAFSTIKCTSILGVSYIFENKELVPKNVPLIFVANHQSLLDTAGIIWYLREFQVLFVTKKELGKSLPAISYNLRNNNYVLIERNNSKQAILKIKSLGQYIEKEQQSAVIFPEGTRSKTGEPIEFAQSGLKILCKYAPSSFIVPITINDSWKVYRYGNFPLSNGHKIRFTIHKPYKVSDFTFEEIMTKTEKTIVEAIKI